MYPSHSSNHSPTNPYWGETAWMLPLWETVCWQVGSQAHDKRVAECTITCNKCEESFHNRAPYNAHIRSTHSTPQPATARKQPAQKTTDALATKKSKRSDQASMSTASEPAPTSAAAASFSWEADPQLVPLNLIPDTKENIAETYRQHWSHIQTRFSCQNQLQDWYNFCLSTISPTTLWATSFLISLLCLKSTSPLVLSDTTQKPAPFSTITHPPITTWSWNSLSWSPIEQFRAPITINQQHWLSRVG